MGPVRRPAPHNDGQQDSERAVRAAGNELLRSIARQCRRPVPFASVLPRKTTKSTPTPRSSRAAELRHRMTSKLTRHARATGPMDGPYPDSTDVHIWTIRARLQPVGHSSHGAHIGDLRRNGPSAYRPGCGQRERDSGAWPAARRSPGSSPPALLPPRLSSRVPSTA
jgi:hypothetical protein